MKYNVEVTLHREITMEVEAGSRAEAARLAYDHHTVGHPGTSISAIVVEELVVAAWCEACDNPIFEDEEYHFGGDDTYICAKCGEEMPEER